MARELVIYYFPDNSSHRSTSVANLFLAADMSFSGDFSYAGDMSSVTDLSSVGVLSYAA